VNELSARYSIIKDDFWLPSEYRTQSIINKQGSGETSFDDIAAHMSQTHSSEIAFQVYDGLVTRGISRELSRIHLPQSTFTEFYWKINLHNLFHFLKLRMDSHAQKEIRDCACEMFELIKPIVPISCEAFMDYRMNALTLTGPETRALKTGDTSHLSKGEKREFEEKCQSLGLQCMISTEGST
jgi:thymidylate synthase (FAD)